MEKATTVYRIATDQPVAFITIDDGYLTDPVATAYVQAKSLPVTQFLTYYATTQGVYEPQPGTPQYNNVLELRKYQTGNVSQKRVGCHQKEHIDYRGQSVADQQNAMGGTRALLGAPEMFGSLPRLFRPPYGYWDDATLQAAGNALMPKLVLWTHAVMNDGAGGWELVNEWGSPRLRAGDILVLHHPSDAGNVNNYLMGQLTVALEKIKSANLTPAYLHDYL